MAAPKRKPQTAPSARGGARRAAPANATMKRKPLRANAVKRDNSPVGQAGRIVGQAVREAGAGLDKIQKSIPRFEMPSYWKPPK